MEPESVMTDKMREEFEKWALSNEGPSVSVMRNEVGRYEDEELNMAWLGWQAARTVPSLHAEQIRVAAVAAIREVTGCPDIKGNDGTYLVDALIVNLLSAAQEPKK